MKSTTCLWFTVTIVSILVVFGDKSDLKDHYDLKARTFDEALKRNVPDELMQNKILNFFQKLPTSERLSSILLDFEHNLTGKPRKKLRAWVAFAIAVFGLFVSVVASAIDLHNKHNERMYQEELMRYNRAMEREKENLERLEKELSELDDREDEWKAQLARKNYCLDKCRRWLELFSCQINRGRCPEVPEDTEQCAFPPICTPRTRCRSDPVTISLKSRDENYGRNQGRKSKKRSSKLNEQQTSGKFIGTELFYRYISDSLGGYTASQNARQLFDELSKDKSLNSSVIYEMYDIMKYFEPKVKTKHLRQLQSSTGTITESHKQDFAEGIPAILIHLLPGFNQTIEQKKVNLEREIDRILYSNQCPPCENQFPEVGAMKCAYTCPNRAGCPHYACNCT